VAAVEAGDPMPAEHSAPPEFAGFPGTQDESAVELLSDCRRAAQRWAAGPCPAGRPVPPSRIHGTHVPEASAHAVDAMADYGG
jgi:hypothetical protein